MSESYKKQELQKTGATKSRLLNGLSSLFASIACLNRSDESDLYAIAKVSSKLCVIC